eukprot:2716046-Prymnesium_polylepis.1
MPACIDDPARGSTGFHDDVRGVRLRVSMRRRRRCGAQDDVGREARVILEHAARGCDVHVEPPGTSLTLILFVTGSGSLQRKQ